MSKFSESWIDRLVFSMIAIIGILGNVLVIWVYIRKHKSYRKTAFDMLIVNLAASDLLGAIFVIFSRFLYLPTMPDSQVGSFLFCSILWGGYILFGLGYASIYTCLLLAIERWLAVIKPHLYRRIRSNHAVRAIIVVWIWAFFINSTVFLSVDGNLNQKKCQWKDPQIGRAFFPLFEIGAACLLPFTTIIILYSHIYHRIRTMTPILATGTLGATKRRLKIALVASIALLVGWLPSTISFMLRYTSVGRSHLDGAAHFIFIMMALGNCCVNPFLYGFYSSKFRLEYIEILHPIFCKKCIERDRLTAEEIVIV